MSVDDPFITPTTIKDTLEITQSFEESATQNRVDDKDQNNLKTETISNNTLVKS